MFYLLLYITVVTCPPITQPDNGNCEVVDPAACGIEITCTCHDGYSLNGTSTSVCQQDNRWSTIGSWSGNRICQSMNIFIIIKTTMFTVSLVSDVHFLQS